MVEAKMMNKGSAANWWWLNAQTNKGVVSNKSPWLQSTLAELDEKTKTMLKIIEEDADSFAQRAEMYYKKRPELVSMVEDFYRTHRSLAERYDQIKSESGIRLPTSPWSSPSPLPFTKFRLEKTLSLNDKAYDSYSEAYGPEEEDESDESEVDDPEEEEDMVQDHLGYEEEEEEEVLHGSVSDEELTKLKEEVEELKEENKLQKDELKQKDEEKREVIRQLTMAIDLLREENSNLRKRIPKTNTNKEELPNKPKESFFGKLFSGLTQSHATHLVAL